MNWFRLPLTVWGFFLTSILNALFVPVLAAAMVLLFFDRVFGTQFFIAGSTIRAGGDPILYQHLFWLFGHPEVYILILPAWGIVSDLLSFFARKPAFGYRVTVWSLIGVVILSCVVYGHHMFTTGMSPLLGESFMLLTMIISVPTSLLFLNWLGTLWRGAARMTTPMLFCVGLVFTFGIGGLTGLYLADIVADQYLHDTYFVVGHFHLIMAAALLMASFAAVYFWFPKMFGRMMSERLGKLHFWPTFLALNVVFIGQLLIGWAGMQRRLYDPSAYEFLQAPAALERLDLARRLRAGRGAAGVRLELLREPAPRQAGAREPVGGRHAGVDAAVAAAAPQLRRHPDRRARAARARPPRRARARQGLAGPGRGRCREPRGAPRRERERANGAVGHGGASWARARCCSRRCCSRTRSCATQASAWPPPGTPPFPRGAAAANGLLLIAAGFALRRARTRGPAWAAGALGAGRAVPADAGGAVGAPGRRPPRPGHGRAGRRRSSRCRRSTRCTCWAGWSRSRSCCGGAPAPTRAPRRLRLATIYMDFVAVVWVDHLRRGVRGMSARGSRPARRASPLALGAGAGLPAPGGRAPDLHGAGDARRAQRRARRARARPRRLHPLLPPLSRRRGRRQGTRRRRPAPAAARSAPRRLQVRGGRRPASCRATTTSCARCASGLHGTAMLSWDVPAAELDDLIQYVKAFAPRWRNEQPGEAIVADARSVAGARSRRDRARPPRLSRPRPVRDRLPPRLRDEARDLRWSPRS